MYCAVYDGVDCVMLSGERMVGRPLLSTRLHEVRTSCDWTRLVCMEKCVPDVI